MSRSDVKGVLNSTGSETCVTSRESIFADVSFINVEVNSVMLPKLEIAAFGIRRPRISIRIYHIIPI